MPYRIYVDSGVVLLCVFALGPASPLIAPAAFTYFLLCVPLLRWTMIFLYRPKFDMGGGRFPFIFDICVSGIITSQILLIAMMVLKAAIGPAVAAFLPMIPTLWFRHFVRKRYLKAFKDAALLQTSLLVSESMIATPPDLSSDGLSEQNDAYTGWMGYKRRNISREKRRIQEVPRGLP